MPKKSERGAIPVLALVAMVGVLGFLIISSTTSFNDRLFAGLFPKKSSFAATSDPSCGTFEHRFDYQCADGTCIPPTFWDAGVRCILRSAFTLSMSKGDANVDNKVDILDYSILRANFGIQTGCYVAVTIPCADFNNNGTVDISDFGILKANFGKSW